MFVSAARRRRGFALTEMLVATLILAALLILVGEAVSHTLHTEIIGSGRATSLRTDVELATRLSEEARSSTAVFVPSHDVLGDANSGASAHEVDFFRRMPLGGDAFVAYCYDAGTGSVTRYAYTRSNGRIVVAHEDGVAEGLTAFVPTRLAVGQLSATLNPAAPQVQLLYGDPELVGGNDVVAVTLRAATAAAIPERTVEVHLATQVAPTSMNVVVTR